MKSILSQLYNGEIYPAEESPECAEEFCEYLHKNSELWKKLEETISPSALQILKDYQATMQKGNQLNSEQAFAQGVRFGVRFILEVYQL